MKRAILVALGTGFIITSAAALTIGHASNSESTAAPAASELERARAQWNARESERNSIEARYLAARAECDALRGARRDRCLIAAHAAKGRALLDTQAPYALR